MKMLVTGGAGFIGSHLVESLLSDGHTVVTLDDLSTGKQHYLESILNHPNHLFIKGSALDRRLVNELMDGMDVVFHMAAVLGVKNTVEDPLKVIEGNIDATRNILEFAYARKVKVIFASTSEVYGKSTQLPYQEESNRVLGPTTTHRWCYSTAKALDEHICFGYAKKGLPITVVRYFNAYGPRQNGTQYGQVIPRFIRLALLGEPITIYGDGEQSRCFTYINDTVEGTKRCLSEKANNQIFNIGHNQEVTIKQLAFKIKEYTNSSSPILYIPYEKAYGEGYEDMEKRVPDISKAKALLDFHPSIDIDEGLMQTIEWYKREIEHLK